MISLLFLDDYHVGDPLFLADLGRRLAVLGAEGRSVIVHRAHEAIERSGIGDPGSDDADVMVAVERAVKEANQTVTRRLIEEGVPAVSIQGSDRGLLRLTERGDIEVGDPVWLKRMISLGSVPVISPLAASATGPHWVDAAVCAAALAPLLRAEAELHATVFCSTRKQGLYRDGAKVSEIALAEVDSCRDVIDVDAVAELAGVVDRLVATNSAGTNVLPHQGTVISNEVIPPKEL